MPTIYWPLYWISPFNYAYSAAVINEFYDTELSFWLSTVGVAIEDKYVSLFILVGMFVVLRLIQLVLLNNA